MTYQSYLTLAEKVMQNPQIAGDFQIFANEMTVLKAEDPIGFSALAAAVGMPELQSIHRTCAGGELTQEQRLHNEQQAQALKQRLRAFELEEYAVLWVVRCWLNALAWPYYDPAQEYSAQVEQLTPAKKEELAMRGDGAAAGSLARMCEEAGNLELAAKWRKIALDCCDLQTMRYIEYASAESGVQFKGYDQLLARHASLGDPEGMAAYALYLLKADPKANMEKAFRLAYQSMEMSNSAASCYAMYQCLGHVQHPEFDMRSAAEDYLEDAADFGYPQAYYERALRCNAQGDCEAAYQNLLLSVKGNELYPGTWDGAVLLARYCVEGKGGAPQDSQQAYEWAQRGAQHGSATALGMLGVMEMQGIGVMQNLSVGAAHIAQAAQAGDMDSIQRMSMLYRLGLGVEADDRMADQYAAQMAHAYRSESVDGFGFEWISLLSAMNQPQHSVMTVYDDEEEATLMPGSMKAVREEDVKDEQNTAQEPVQEMAAPTEEDEAEIILLPEELERLKAEEAAEAAMQAPEQEVYTQEETMLPSEPAQAVQDDGVQPEQMAFMPVEMQMPHASAPSHVLGTLLYCINHIWDQIDDEMVNMTGEPASDEMLVDLLLVSLCGMMIAFEDDEKKKQAYHGVLAEFDRRMPDFAELGYDRAYLDRRYKELAHAMHDSRMQRYAQAERDGVAYSWEAACAIEREVIDGMIGVLLQLSEAMAKNMDFAVQRMFQDLTMQLFAKE